MWDSPHGFSLWLVVLVERSVDGLVVVLPDPLVARNVLGADLRPTRVDLRSREVNCRQRRTDKSGSGVKRGGVGEEEGGRELTCFFGVGVDLVVFEESEVLVVPLVDLLDVDQVQEGVLWLPSSPNPNPLQLTHPQPSSTSRDSLTKLKLKISPLQFN